MLKLSGKIGRQKAHELLKQLSNNEDFLTAVKSNEIVRSYFSEEEIDEILDPMNYIGLSSQIVEKLVSDVRKKLNR